MNDSIAALELNLAEVNGLAANVETPEDQAIAAAAIEGVQSALYEARRRACRLANNA